MFVSSRYFNENFLDFKVSVFFFNLFKLSRDSDMVMKRGKFILIKKELIKVEIGENENNFLSFFRAFQKSFKN